MIITRTPFRISFFGGGTDYPAWYQQHGGVVLGTSIDKYAYITCRFLPPFFEHSHRVVYSKLEHVNSVDEIEHPAVRTCLQYMGIGQGVEIHYDGDLPARSGMGSSSAFTVGLLNALYALKGRMASKIDLGREAIYVEQEIIRENVGCQDQVLAAIGGFNKIDFLADGRIQPKPVILPRERLQELESHLMLFFTGISRYASDIAGEVIQAAKQGAPNLRLMQQLVDEALSVLYGDGDIEDFGKLLAETWHLKRGLTSSIATSVIDDLYEEAQRGGAIGGKLLGAGGGGFFLLFARPEDQPKIRERLHNVIHVPFAFDHTGTEIIYYNSETHRMYEKLVTTEPASSRL